MIHVPGFYENRCTQLRKHKSDVVAPPSTVVAGDENFAQVEDEANMVTKNLGGGLNADNSYNLKTPSVTPDTSQDTVTIQDLRDSIPQQISPIRPKLEIKIIF